MKVEMRGVICKNEINFKKEHKIPQAKKNKLFFIVCEIYLIVMVG